MTYFNIGSAYQILQNHDKAIEYLKRLNGRIHIVCGNHCTNRRVEAYKNLPNIVEVIDSKIEEVSKKKKIDTDHLNKLKKSKKKGFFLFFYSFVDFCKVCAILQQ